MKIYYNKRIGHNSRKSSCNLLTNIWWNTGFARDLFTELIYIYNEFVRVISNTMKQRNNETTKSNENTCTRRYLLQPIETKFNIYIDAFQAALTICRPFKTAHKINLAETLRDLVDRLRFASRSNKRLALKVEKKIVSQSYIFSICE